MALPTTARAGRHRVFMDGCTQLEDFEQTETNQALQKTLQILPYELLISTTLFEIAVRYRLVQVKRRKSPPPRMPLAISSQTVNKYM